MYTIEDIKNVVFTRVGRGYRIDEVDEFIDEVVRTMEATQKNTDALMQKLGVLADKIEEYRAQEGSIHNALLTAQRAADQITKDAQETAAKLKEESERTAAKLESEARQKANALTEQAEADYQAKLADTKQQATKVIAEAKDRSGRMLFDALEKSRAERAALEEMKRQTQSFKDQLIAMYHEQIALIERLAAQERVIPAPPVAAETAAQDKAEAVEAAAAVATAKAKHVASSAAVVDEVPDAVEQVTPAQPEMPSTPEPVDIQSHSDPEPVEEKEASSPIVQPVQRPVASAVDQPQKNTPPASVPAKAPTRFQIDADPEEERPSKFSNLKFGEDYDLSDDEDYLEEEPSRGFFKKRKNRN